MEKKKIFGIIFVLTALFCFLFCRGDGTNNSLSQKTVDVDLLYASAHSWKIDNYGLHSSKKLSEVYVFDEDKISELRKLSKKEVIQSLLYSEQKLEEKENKENIFIDEYLLGFERAISFVEQNNDDDPFPEGNVIYCIHNNCYNTFLIGSKDFIKMEDVEGHGTDGFVSYIGACDDSMIEKIEINGKIKYFYKCWKEDFGGRLTNAKIILGDLKKEVSIPEKVVFGKYLDGKWYVYYGSIENIQLDNENYNKYIVNTPFDVVYDGGEGVIFLSNISGYIKLSAEKECIINEKKLKFFIDEINKFDKRFELPVFEFPEMDCHEYNGTIQTTFSKYAFILYNDYLERNDIGKRIVIKTNMSCFEDDECLSDSYYNCIVPEDDEIFCVHS